MSVNTKFSFALVFVLATFLVPHANAEDVILQWNRVLADCLKSDLTIQNPGMSSRTFAMTNIAMYDAVNSISPQHNPFYVHAAAPENASADAAALRAGYRVAAAVYPGELTLLDAGYERILNSLPDNEATSVGVSFGDVVGQSVVEKRSTDGYANMVSYTPTNVVGHWQPDPLNPSQDVWGPEWGKIETFGIPDSRSMMPPAMPSLTSQQYTDAFNEVKELGALHSTTRTDDQKAAGLFWAYDRAGMGTPVRMYSRVLDTIATDQANDLHDNARMFAMAATSMADAAIVAWDSKFEYDFWRPISGIRQADDDGNPDTIADPDWVPLGSPGGVGPDGKIINDFTPPFPTYVSGHASFGGALFKSLETFYGTDDIAFSLASEEMPEMVRTYETFSEAMRESGRSRVYLGIHWDFDDLVARDVGGGVAEYVAANHFQSVPEPSSNAMLLAAAYGLLLTRRRQRRCR